MEEMKEPTYDLEERLLEYSVRIIKNEILNEWIRLYFLKIDKIYRIYWDFRYEYQNG